MPSSRNRANRATKVKLLAEFPSDTWRPGPAARTCQAKWAIAVGPLDCRREQSIDSPRNRQSRLASSLWPRSGGHDQRLWRAWQPSFAPSVARFSRAVLNRKQNGRSNNFTADIELEDLQLDSSDVPESSALDPENIYLCAAIAPFGCRANQRFDSLF